MFGRRKKVEERLFALIERFRQQGALSPEKAMTTEELGLPSRFEEVMKKRLGRLGIFVEVNGKYYLSEERLKQLEELRSVRVGANNQRKKAITLRVVQLVILAIFLTLLFVNLFVQSWELRILSGVFLLIWLLLLILRLYYLKIVQRRMLF